MEELNRRLCTISDFLGNGIIYSDFVMEFESGKSVKSEEFENVCIEEKGDELFLTAEKEGYRIGFNINKSCENMISLKATVTPVGKTDDKVHKITTAKLNIPYSRDGRVYINPAFKEGIYKVEDIPEECNCRNFFAYYRLSAPEKAVTITSALPAKFRSDISVTKNDEVISTSFTTTIPYSFEGEVVCQEWIISTNMSVSDSLEKIADKYSSGRTFENPIGWSTWDYYFTSATEDDVKENVDFIAEDEVLSKKVRYIALDDGWQQREGDWRSGIRYPSGLKSLVEYIKSKGFEAGIWVAPTRLHFLCGTIMRRNDFLVRDEYGDPVCDEDMFVLDPTHPDGEKFIRETFTYLAECGFTFYKLDFISNMINFAERFYDKNAGHFDALVRLFEIVRETVPEGSHIMGCSLPYAATNVLADSKRTGWDIHNVWGHLKLCTATYVPQFASNGKLHRNDLDYLIVRGKDTSDDEMTNVISPKNGYNKVHPTENFVWRKGEDFSFSEAKTWCNILLMAGSSVFMGDKLTLLNKKGIDLVKKTVASADFCAATPVFSEESIPEIWYKSELGKIYVFNFGEDEKKYEIKLENLIPDYNGEYVELFTEKVYKAENGVLSITLDAHDSVCLVRKK